ncbi:methyltransferase [Rhodococcus sp. KBS0724]|jgi:release factor glutamine methyltransferase|uniref:HemK2/MTQ2 family protein methyltransferase n=1 Tax=Rhodococcus sp. KBS0724 TaxID=1179674 RepID=UPI00110E441E|nr:HemK2/MTQ2 family protein methyltransferase [Rhodococcus sp. KBS0724]TSD47460.1 methyltransferase [Rhodococcus sp. KBS0724]
MLVRLPGVYPPQEDTWLLAGALARENLGPHSHVLDICTGTGALSMCAAAAGAGNVTAVDISRRALATTWINARLGRHSVRMMRGNLTEPVGGQFFDVIVSNPPYVPALDDVLPTRGVERAWDAGVDGRMLLDRICAQAPSMLAQSGVLLIAQSVLSGVEKTQTMLEERGLGVEIADRAEIPFGRILSARAALFEARGLIDSGQRTEEIVVIRAVR